MKIIMKIIWIMKEIINNEIICENNNNNEIM